MLFECQYYVVVVVVAMVSGDYCFSSWSFLSAALAVLVVLVALVSVMVNVSVVEEVVHKMRLVD